MWAWLDVLVVVTSVWEVAVLLLQSDEAGEVAGFSGLKALRIIRHLAKPFKSC